jgi:hypothetical protein
MPGRATTAYETHPGLTINVPVVCVARDLMILMRKNPLLGPLEGVGEDEIFWALK